MLQPSAQRDEDEQHRRRIEERQRRRVLLQHNGGDQHAARVHVADGGGHRDQHVHVGGAVSHRAVRLHVEMPAAKELHRRGQHEHDQVLQRQAGQEDAAHVLVSVHLHDDHEVDHGHHAWTAEAQRDEEGSAPLVDLVLVLQIAVRHFALVRENGRIVAELLDALADLTGARLLAVEHKATAFGGQSDGGRGDAGNGERGALDFGHARRAGHAVDADLDGALAGAGLVDHLGGEAQAADRSCDLFGRDERGVVLDLGFGGEQCDQDAVDAVDFATVLLDGGYAAGASHALDVHEAFAEVGRVDGDGGGGFAVAVADENEGFGCVAGFGSRCWY